MKTITFTISADGSTIESDAAGFTGRSCEETLKPVLQRLGNVDDDKKKPEYSVPGSVSALSRG